MAGRTLALFVLAWSLLPFPLDSWGGASRPDPSVRTETPPDVTAEVDRMTDIRDIKPSAPYAAGTGWLPIAAALLGLLACLGAWLAWRRRRARPKETGGIPLLPPHAEALEAIHGLRRKQEIGDKAFYFELSSILRAYLDARFGLETAEKTTEEVLPVLKDVTLAQELRSELADLLRFADPVKYADAAAGESRRAAHIHFAEAFVNATAPAETGEAA